MNHTDNTAADERTLDDPLGEVLDVVGLNEYLGWYGGRPEDADKLQWKLTWNKPLIVSEFRGGAPYGRPGDADGRWTVEYQENLYQHQLGIVERMPNLAGMSPCVLMDFRSPLRMLPGVQDYHDRKRSDFESRAVEGGVLYAAEVLWEAGGCCNERRESTPITAKETKVPEGKSTFFTGW